MTTPDIFSVTPQPARRSDHRQLAPSLDLALPPSNGTDSETRHRFGADR
jgi:hypothetical protein